jgi:lysophospholipase L1-like esterase
MKTILAFGDSLTFGAPPDDMPRHARNDRWPMALQIGLGHEYEVIPEGLNGRTTVFGDPITSFLRAGSDALPTLLHTHQPLDLVIVMLGVNDIMVAERSARAATRGMARLVEIIRTHPYLDPSWTPEILLVAPPPPITDAAGEITERDLTETRQLGPRYEALAGALGTGFFDGGTVTTGALPDGVHLSAEGSSALGTALVDVVHARIG